ncbi:cytochrome b5 domain-containing protein [Clostridium paraputrificum]|uniref:cytochrome b5 domain-containing protein n=1 Tax=Clostridium TaxID=1485 RepID=UPI003D32C053
MSKEKILNKKFEKLNELKAKLVSRSEESKEDIVEEIKDTMEDLELILEDFEYIKNPSIALDIEDAGYRAMKEYTLEELEKYDGKEGRPAYVVVEGKVYDVTNNPYWKNGSHFGANSGEEMTKTFYECHAKSTGVLKKLPVVGILGE